ncbi:MAG: tRNA (adenosine(37)-N6)-threonylcarbamoyltransferase complex dimerization subunit type 1 TsaB [Rhodoferax sp.]|nr:tRNA (adenosine(37)-N6)-threonylcarbamoyltransferase complex dimerization subunit type 1 TsaB [Rhodoferax sp.]
MNLLAFDTTTQTMSIAVARTLDGHDLQWQHTGVGAAQASCDLIPAILKLMQRAQLRLDELDAICFGQGPGAFTGLRTACAVAQGLAMGAGVPVLPINSLLAIAEEARHTALETTPRGIITTMLDARMDEVYIASYAFDAGQWTELQEARLLAPQNLDAYLDALAKPCVLAGNVFTVYHAQLAQTRACAAPAPVTALPTAAAMLRLAPQALQEGHAVRAKDALPCYVRDKVAQTTQERNTEKAAALASAR